MKDYASMSDQQINQLVGSKVGELQLGARSACCIGSDGNVLVLKGGMWTIFDPCNNPADAWPILLENEISLLKFNDSDTWEAWGDVSSCYGEVGRVHAEPDENPLRAGMIVFLMMKESEND